MNQIKDENTRLNIIKAISALEEKMATEGAKARLFIFERNDINVLASADALEEILDPVYSEICAKAFDTLKKFLALEKNKILAAIDSNTEPYRCSNCGYKTDKHPTMFGEYKPTPGSISVCYNCGQPGIFMEDMSVLKISDKVMEEIKEKQPSLYAQIMATSASVKRKIVYN